VSEQAATAKTNGEWSGTVELAVAGALAFCAIVASVWAAPGWIGAGGAWLALLCVAIAVVDRRRFIIPDTLNAAAVISGLAVSALTADDAVGGLVGAAARAAVMFVAFIAFRFAFRRLRGVEGMGLGDVKLAAAVGAWLDWADLPLAVDIAALAALAAALVRRLRRDDLDMRSRLPFGAFLAPAIWLCWMMATVAEKGVAGPALAAFGATR